MITSEELLNTLEDLKEEEFKKFQWYLQQAGSMKDLPAIKKSQLENKDRHNTVDLMIQVYNGDIKEAALKVLGKIRRNDLVQKLSERGSGEVGQSQEETNAASLQSDNSIPPMAQNKKIYLPSLIRQIVQDSQERGGISDPALTKALAAHGYDVNKNKARLQTTLMRMVKIGTLEKTNLGYKIINKTETKKKRPVNTAAPQAKKTTTKKPAAAKTSITAAAKKQSATTMSSETPGKPKKAAKTTKRVNASPKQAKKPAAAKKATKTANMGPKKAKKPAAAKRAKKDPKKGIIKIPAVKKAGMKKRATTKVNKGSK